MRVEPGLTTGHQPFEMSAGYHRGQFLGLDDHLLDLRSGGDAVAQALLAVNLDEAAMEVGRDAVAQLLAGVDSRSLKQFGELAGHPFDAEQVGVIDPFQHQFRGDYCGLRDFLPPFGYGPWARSCPVVSIPIWRSLSA